MAELNFNYYSGEDLYSDGDIEDEILRVVKKGLTLEELPADKISYPVLYHLSDIRKNILNWYPFSSNAKILEIGAGCGAITGLLCEKCDTLVSVELSKRRASINYERHKNHENLSLYVGNFNEMKFPFKFDYVILNGVFEYAMSFTDGEEPYVKFLQNILPLLSEKGKIIIAIENKLGIKYFAGAVEDHVGQHFFGLNNYPGNKTVRTFSKSELVEIFQKAGIDFYRFYYPYPDYKFPIEVFTDKTLKPCEYGKFYYSFDNNRYQLFNEKAVTDNLLTENIMGQFANSFLVEIGQKDFLHEDYVSYAKMNSYREDKFKIITTLEEEQGGTVVYKQAMKAEADEHIKRLYTNTNKASDLQLLNLQGQFIKNKLQYPFLTSNNLSNDIKDWIKAKEGKKIFDIINDIYCEYKKEGLLMDNYQIPEFAKVFGTSSYQCPLICVNYANIDLICDNIFRQDSHYLVIDCEWIFDFYIPVQFTIYRLLKDLYAKFYDLHALIPCQTFFEAFAITDELTELFDYWNNYFMNHYVNHSRVSRYAKSIPILNVDELIAANEPLQFTCNLYYDTGGGFKEEQKIISYINSEDEEFSVDYDLTEFEDIKALRWDPLENYLCKCEFFYTDVSLQPVNAIMKDGNTDIFATSDPAYMIESNGKPKFSIKGKIQLIEPQEFASYLVESIQQKKNSEESYMVQMKKMEETYIVQIDEMKIEFEKNQSKKECEINNLNQKVVELNDQLNMIYQTKGWKILNRLRNVKKKIIG